MGIDKALRIWHIRFRPKPVLTCPANMWAFCPAANGKPNVLPNLPTLPPKNGAGEMVSVSIGQGYNAYTPLQMAHATASLANNGVVYQPHLVKEVLDFGARKITRINPNPERQIPFKTDNFEYVKRAMERY